MAKDNLGPLMDAIVKCVMDQIRPLDRRLTALEINQPKYCGVWKHNTVYAVNNWVTDKGGIWVCKHQTTARPGENSTDWQLGVKSGRDI